MDLLLSLLVVLGQNVAVAVDAQKGKQKRTRPGSPGPSPSPSLSPQPFQSAKAASESIVVSRLSVVVRNETEDKPNDSSLSPDYPWWPASHPSLRRPPQSMFPKYPMPYKYARLCAKACQATANVVHPPCTAYMGGTSTL